MLRVAGALLFSAVEMCLAFVSIHQCAIKLFAPPAYAVAAISTVGVFCQGGGKSVTIVWHSSQAPMATWTGVMQGDSFQSMSS